MEITFRESHFIHPNKLKMLGVYLVGNLKVLQSYFHLLLCKAIDVSKCLLALVLTTPGRGSRRVRGEDMLYRVRLELIGLLRRRRRRGHRG